MPKTKYLAAIDAHVREFRRQSRPIPPLPLQPNAISGTSSSPQHLALDCFAVIIAVVPLRRWRRGSWWWYPASDGGEPLGLHVGGGPPWREVEAPLLEGLLGCRAQDWDYAVEFRLAPDEHRREDVSQLLICPRRPCHLELGLEVDVHDQSAMFSLPVVTSSQDIDVLVIACWNNSDTTESVRKGS